MPARFDDRSMGFGHSLRQPPSASVALSCLLLGRLQVSLRYCCLLFCQTLRRRRGCCCSFPRGRQVLVTRLHCEAPLKLQPGQWELDLKMPRGGP